MIYLKEKRHAKGKNIQFRVEKKHKTVEHNLNYEIKQVFIGHHTILTVIGFTISGILIGRTLWQWSVTYIGLLGTFLLGLVLFVFFGIILGSFHDDDI